MNWGIERAHRTIEYRQWSARWRMWSREVRWLSWKVIGHKGSSGFWSISFSKIHSIDQSFCSDLKIGVVGLFLCMLRLLLRRVVVLLWLVVGWICIFDEWWLVMVERWTDLSLNFGLCKVQIFNLLVFWE